MALRVERIEVFDLACRWGGSSWEESGCAMSIASVSHRYVLGGICHGSLCYVDENTAVWAAGGNMVVTNLENLKQKFIPIPGGIRHLTVSSDHRIIAVAGGEGVTQWEVAGWRRRKLVVGPNGEKDFVCVAFSSDGKYLVGVEPTGGLLMWSWERGKVVGGFQFPVTEEEMQQQVELAVEDRDVCFLVGGKCYRGICGEAGVWSAEQAGDKNVSYSATLWISATETTGARLALGTTHGEIHVLSGWNIVHRIKDSRIGAITSLLGIGRGFAVAGSDGNEVILYDESERLNVREVKRVPIGEGATPWITGSGVDRAIWVVRAGGIWKFNIGETKGPGAEEASPPTLLIPGFHTASITSLDLCTRKPILMTCASDRTVRIYNYETHQMIIERTFSEELWSVALHPSGLWCLIVGGDKIRICTILDGELRINREIGVRGCRECRFSNGGHLFATTHTNIINLYHTYTFDLYTTLKGHTQRINSLQWSEDDRFLVSAGAEGAVYCWDVRDGRRVNEHVVKGNCYTSAVGGDGGGRMWCCGSDSTVKEVTESTVSVEWPSDVALTQIALSHDKKMLFTGTATGAIRALKFPLSSRPEEFQEHAAHSAPVTKLRISYDDQYLFSSAADGTVYCFRIAGGEKGVRTERNMAWADEILITKSDLEERQLLTSELNHQLTELQLEHEYQLRLCDMTYNEKLKEVTERYSGELEALKITLNNVRAEKDKEEVRREEERSMALDKHKEQVHALETKYNQQLMDQYEKFQLAQERSQGLQTSWEAQLKDFQISQRKSLNDAQAEGEARVKAKQGEIEKLQALIQTTRAEHNETIEQATVDLDTEMQLLLQRYEKRLRQEREEGARLKGENGIMRKKFISITKEIDDARSEELRLKENEKRLRSIIESFEKDVAALKREMAERDALIQEKERRVYDLKKKNQELEKFKFVLDFRIKELKEQVEPRENHISELHNNIKDINMALETLSSHEHQYKLEIDDLDGKLKIVTSEYAEEHRRCTRLERAIRGVLVDVEETVQWIQDPNLLRQSIENLTKKYLTVHGARRSHTDPEVQREYETQTYVLQRTAQDLKKQVEKNALKFREDSFRNILVNRELIREIGQLRSQTRSKNSEKELKRFQLLAVGKRPMSPEKPQVAEGATGSAQQLRLPSLVGV